ncbi:MAG: hypothetical protein R3B67_12740 [Phycisphaerales bacterium]
MATDQPNPPRKARKERRGIWWALVLISLVAIIVAGIELTKRIGAYYEQVEHPLFAYIQVASTDFTFAGRDVKLEELQLDSGEKLVRVTFDDQTLDLDVVYPPKHELPTLFDRQREWLGMFFFADRSRMTMQEFERRIMTDEIQPRLAIVTPHTIRRRARQGTPIRLDRPRGQREHRREPTRPLPLRLLRVQSRRYHYARGQAVPRVRQEFHASACQCRTQGRARAPAV